MSVIRETVLRTKSPKYNHERITRTRFGWALTQAMQVGRAVATLKRDLFYENEEDLPRAAAPLSQHLELTTVESERDTIHGILGLIDEAGEIASGLHGVLNGTSSQEDWEANLLEELGDVLWFLEVCCQGLGTDLDSIAEINRAKLHARYKDSFSTEEALNRNLERESQAMTDASEDET